MHSSQPARQLSAQVMDSLSNHLDYNNTTVFLHGMCGRLFHAKFHPHSNDIQTTVTYILSVFVDTECFIKISQTFMPDTMIVNRKFQLCKEKINSIQPHLYFSGFTRSSAIARDVSSVETMQNVAKMLV